RRVDARDVDVRAEASLAGHRRVGHEVADHVAAAVVEARPLGIAAESPAEDGLVERREAGRVRRGNPEIRHATGTEDARPPRHADPPVAYARPGVVGLLRREVDRDDTGPDVELGVLGVVADRTLAD